MFTAFSSLPCGFTSNERQCANPKHCAMSPVRSPDWSRGSKLASVVLPWFAARARQGWASRSVQHVCQARLESGKEEFCYTGNTQATVCRNAGLPPLTFETGAWREASSVPGHPAEYSGTKDLRMGSYRCLMLDAVLHRPPPYICRSAPARKRANSRSRKMESEAVCSPGIGTNKKR
jgi:hypothetical protein